MHTGEVDFALIQSDWQENIKKYYGDFAEFKNYDPIRSVLSLQEEIMTVVVRKYSKINSLDDVRGKVINLPMSDMSFKTMFSIFLKAKKWGIELFSKVVDFSHSEQIRALCDGRIDSMFLLVSHPDRTIDIGSKACELKILDIPMNFNNPSMSKSILRGGIYRGINRENSSIGMSILLVTTNKEENIVVKTLLDSILNSLPEFNRSNPLLKYVTRESLLKHNITIEPHPVVVGYLKKDKGSRKKV